MYCTTCGHMWFRYGLWEIAKGVHPDATDWRVSGDRQDLMRGSSAPELGPVPPLAGWPLDIQRSLCAILAKASLASVRSACTFPDWLGYLGLALHYSEDAERRGRLITQSWAPQLARLFPEASPVTMLLADVSGRPDGILTWRMLESVEIGMRTHRRNPYAGG